MGSTTKNPRVGHDAIPSGPTFPIPSGTIGAGSRKTPSARCVNSAICSPSLRTNSKRSVVEAALLGDLHSGQESGDDGATDLSDLGQGRVGLKVPGLDLGRSLKAPLAPRRIRRDVRDRDEEINVPHCLGEHERRHLVKLDLPP